MTRLAFSVERLAHGKAKSVVIVWLIAALGCGAKSGQAEQTKADLERQAIAFAVPKTQPVAVELIVEHASVQPGGKTRIGVHFTLEDGWHIYAQNPGDAGMPTKVEWTLVDGAGISGLSWPAAQDFVDAGNITTHGYTASVVLESTLTVNSAVPLTTVLPLRAHVEWLACKEICVPGSANLGVDLPVSASQPLRSPHAELFEQAAPS